MSVIKNLHGKWDDFVLDIPELHLLDAGVAALVGPSGSGKSTLVHALLGVVHVPGWSWSLDAANMADLPPAERRLGVVFQDFALFPHMTAKENIFFAAEARRVPRDVRDQLYERLNELLRLSSFADRRAVKLSGGEKQRVALARALMGQPRFLFLDEPFSSLDAQLRGEARRLVQMTLKDMGIPALLITHDEEDVRALASQVIRIHSGKIQS